MEKRGENSRVRFLIWTVFGIILMAGLIFATTTISDTGIITDGNISISVLNVSNFLFANSSNVGIGTITPNQKLEVRGNGNFSGTIYINNITDVSTLGNSSWNQSFARGLVFSTNSTFNSTYATYGSFNSSTNIGNLIGNATLGAQFTINTNITAVNNSANSANSTTNWANLGRNNNLSIWNLSIGYEQISTNCNGSSSCLALCSAGKMVVGGGGYSTNASTIIQNATIFSFPQNTSAWNYTLLLSGTNANLYTQAICMRIGA